MAEVCCLAVFRLRKIAHDSLRRVANKAGALVFI